MAAKQSPANRLGTSVQWICKAKKAAWLGLLLVAGGEASAELMGITDEQLSQMTAQEGVTIDMDFSGVGFNFSYANSDNPNETHWNVSNGTSGETVIINGVTLDVSEVNNGSIAIGIPVEVTLSNVNTGDYFIADPGSDTGSPPRPDEIGESVTASNLNADRKLFGLKWNTPIEFDFSSPDATKVETHNFTPHQFHGAGSVLIFAD